MAPKPVTTAISNSHLNHLLTLADTHTINVEDGVWEVEQGTYNLIKKAAQHVRCEMAKQSRQRRKTMRVNVVQDPERQIALSRQYQDNNM